MLLDPLPQFERPPLDATLPIAPSRPSVPKTGTSAPPVYAPPAGATTERPLGTLFGITAVPTSAQAIVPNPPPSQPVSSPESPHTISSGPTSATSAGSADSSEPLVHFLANEMSFDREKGIVTAQGNVEVRYDTRILNADRITYDQNNDIVSASGNVALLEPTGERLFGDKMEISGDLKDAVILNIGMILKDRSRIAGTGARHSEGKLTELRKGVYSPCNLCADNPNAPPLWQIKAVKVIHNKDEKIIEYRDAWLEMFGFPVAYTPYFRHPDPTVKRKSGFLFPRIGNSSDFGTIVEVPYFWALSDHEDLTLRPILMTEEAPVLGLQYRKRFLKGTIDADASITDNSEDQFTTEEGEFGVRGHFDAKARFDLNKTWRWGIDAKRSTDDTYMRRYGFGSPQSLDSQVFVEGLKGGSYFSAKSMAFQGLQDTDEHDETPVVLPLVDFSHVGNNDRLGGRFNFDLNFLALTRAKGTDTRRLALHPRWQRPFQGPFGDLYRFETGLNADLYHVNSLTQGGDKETFSGLAHRLFPYADLNWRMPLVKSQGTVRQILEPIASLAIAPNGGNPDEIPNEDSTDFEFDETNLFSFNRFSGIDRVEGGTRVNYGLKWGLYGKSGGSSTVFLGQTYRLRADSTFGAGSGLEENLSDIVGSISVVPNSHLNVLYRTRVASDKLSPRRNEVNLTAGVPAFKIAGSYSFLASQADSEFSGREEMNLSAKSIINRFWRTGVTAVHDMQASEMRSLALNATYENECVVFTSRLSRTFFEDRDLTPTDAITFHLVLKTIGEVRSGASISSN
ncbi:MAG: LPS-assembly protein LptD [Rhodospirillaceae bacterium]|nr:LPS-assembly protein LptD [Rhodospirillaceae bacterium]